MKYLILMATLFFSTSFAQTLDGGRWNYYPPACFPNVDAIDYRIDTTEAPAGAIIWWCDYDNVITENSRASKNSAKLLNDIVKDFRNSEVILIYAKEFSLRPLEDDMKRIDKLRTKFKPKCYSINNSVYSRDENGNKVLTKFKISIDTEVACGYTLESEDERFCYVGGSPDQRMEEYLPYDSWSQCKIVLAPENGWKVEE